jgi:hypothetical protein
MWPVNPRSDVDRLGNSSPQVFSMDELKTVRTYRMEEPCVPTACLPLTSAYVAAAFR